MILLAGTLLGQRYEIVEQIGAGGMSIVYKAEDRKLKRFVAIKVLREEFARDNDFVRKFEAEAAAAGRLSHSNIVGVYDVCYDDGLHYIVMEYISGYTLKDVIINEAPFSEEKVINYATQILGALKVAHENKIIHRDIKPQNIMVTADGRLKVTDFGIARAVSSSTITLNITCLSAYVINRCLLFLYRFLPSGANSANVAFKSVSTVKISAGLKYIVASKISIVKKLAPCDFILPIIGFCILFNIFEPVANSLATNLPDNLEVNLGPFGSPNNNPVNSLLCPNSRDDLGLMIAI